MVLPSRSYVPGRGATGCRYSIHPQFRASSEQEAIPRTVTVSLALAATTQLLMTTRTEPTKTAQVNFRLATDIGSPLGVLTTVRRLAATLMSERPAQNTGRDNHPDTLAVSNMYWPVRVGEVGIIRPESAVRALMALPGGLLYRASLSVIVRLLYVLVLEFG
jgi:hypothetical protein